MKGSVLRLPAVTSQAELLATIDRLNEDPTVHGILVQLPLPSGIDEHAVVEQLSPLKDVDGLHPFNLGLLAAGTPAIRAVHAAGRPRTLDALPCRDAGGQCRRPGPIAARG